MKDYTKKSIDLTSMADYLVILHELDTTKSAEATSVRDKVVGEFETNIGIIGNSDMSALSCWIVCCPPLLFYPILRLLRALLRKLNIHI